MKDFKEPLVILLVLFVLLGLAYSPLKKASQNNSQKSSSDSTIGTDPNIEYSPNKNVGEEIKNVEQDIKILEENINKKIEESHRSPYYGKVSMSSVSGLYGSDPSQEYISLYTNLEETETIKITNWYLKSELTGYYALIGQASLLPFPFTKTESDINLAQGDRAYIIKGFSPIGISFRTNKCTGYFEENRNFTPSLSLQCPRVIDEDLPNFSAVYDRNDECLDIIENISRCTTKNNSFTRDLADTVSTTCKNYITTQINYNTCVARHFSDTDFPGNEYYIYLNKFGPLWRQKHDKIILHDQNGLIVDSVSY